MELKITGKNIEIAESLRVFIERKISKLEKLAKKELRVTVTLSEQTSKKTKKSSSVEVVLDTQGKVLSAKDDKENFYVAVDSVTEKLRRQLKKFKNKRIEKTKDRMTVKFSVASAPPPEQAVGEPDLEVATFSLKPLSVADAIIKLKDSSRSFFVFVNEDQTINCIYTKEDGKIGLIVPEAS